MSKMKDRMHTGELYLPGDEEIMAKQCQCLEKLYDFNGTRPSEMEKRTAPRAGPKSHRIKDPLLWTVLYASFHLAVFSYPLLSFVINQ